jgi:hypothetical protein
MRIHPTILFVLIKNLVIGGAIYYWSGPQLLLWWIAASAILYALVALNGFIQLEERFKEAKSAEL